MHPDRWLETFILLERILVAYCFLGAADNVTLDSPPARNFCLCSDSPFLSLEDFYDLSSSVPYPTFTIEPELGIEGH